jgi:hypothetical protein
MRRSSAGFLAGLAAGAGALVVFRRRLLLRRRRRPDAQPADPAEELKQKLEESRAEPAAPEAAPEPGPAPNPKQPEPSLDERRTEVHERGRAAIERMRGEPPTDQTL